MYEDLTQPVKGSEVYYQMKLYYSGPARRAGEAMMLKDAANRCSSRAAPGSTCPASAA